MSPLQGYSGKLQGYTSSLQGYGAGVAPGVLVDFDFDDTNSRYVYTKAGSPSTITLRNSSTLSVVASYNTPSATIVTARNPSAKTLVGTNANGIGGHFVDYGTGAQTLISASLAGIFDYAAENWKHMVVATTQITNAVTTETVCSSTPSGIVYKRQDSDWVTRTYTHTIKNKDNTTLSEASQGGYSFSRIEGINVWPQTFEIAGYSTSNNASIAFNTIIDNGIIKFMGDRYNTAPAPCWINLSGDVVRIVYEMAYELFGYIKNGVFNALGEGYTAQPLPFSTFCVGIDNEFVYAYFTQSGTSGIYKLSLTDPSSWSLVVQNFIPLQKHGATSTRGWVALQGANIVHCSKAGVKTTIKTGVSKLHRYYGDTVYYSINNNVYSIKDNGTSDTFLFAA